MAAPKGGNLGLDAATAGAQAEAPEEPMVDIFADRTARELHVTLAAFIDAMAPGLMPRLNAKARDYVKAVREAFPPDENETEEG